MRSSKWGINKGSILVFAWDHRKPQKHQSASPVPGQDSNFRPPKDKSESSQLQSTCSVSVLLTFHNSGKEENIHHSAPGISLFKHDHMPIQNRPYTPLKHQKLPHIQTHTHHHI